MRLDFNTLWVEDQPSAVQAQVDRIAQEMRREGFEFKPTVCRSIEEVVAQISDDVFNDQVDLVLVDWNLGAGEMGQDAIARIRLGLQYKDVIFYSAHQEASELRQVAYERGLEGVFCTTRHDLVVEVMGVFDSLVKKVLDIDHARGIVLGATSDIEWMVRDCIIAMHNRLDAPNQATMLNEALARIQERVKETAAKIEKLRAEPSIAEVLGQHAIFTANDGLRMIKRSLKQDAFDDLKAHEAAVSSYMTNVVPKRNDMGHLVLGAQGNPRTVVDNAGREVSLDEMRDLRRLLLDLRDQFRELHGSLRRET